jgi:hypothetical protein
MTGKFFGQTVLQLKPYSVKVLRILFNLMTRAIVNVTERWPNPLTGHKIAERHIYIYIYINNYAKPLALLNNS